MYDEYISPASKPLPFIPTGDADLDGYLALKAGQLAGFDAQEALARIDEIASARPARHVSGFMWRIFQNRLDDFRVEINRRAKAAD